MSRYPKLVGWVAYLFYLLLNGLNLLYLIRFQLLTLLFVLSLRFLIFNLGIASSLLAGMFDLPTFWNVLWFSFFSYMLSWTAITLLKLTLRYTDMRFQVGKRIDLDFTKNKLYNQILFFTGFLAPIVLFTGIFWVKEGWKGQLAGAIVGAVAAFAILFLVDLAQLALSDFSKGKDMAEEDLLIPFTNWLYREAADYKPKTKVLNLGLIGWLERLLAKLPPKYGEGYIIRRGKDVKILPGHIFSFIFFLTFLLLYIVGFIFWYYGYTPGHSVFNNLNMGVTSISYVMILLTLLCSLLSGFAFFFDRYRIPTLIVVAVILYFASLHHHYNVRDAAENRKLPPAELIKSKKDHPYIIVVATNGGGIQASAWTAKVLSELVKECHVLAPGDDKGCENAITMISSVSGGSVGTMFFVNSYDNGHLDKEKLKNGEIIKLAEESSLDYVAGGLVYADFVRNLRVFNFLDLQDRGNALERSWLENINKNSGNDTAAAKSLNGYLSDWREDARNGKRPAVIFNSTMAETGSKFIFPTSDTERPKKYSTCSDDDGHIILYKGWDSFYNVFEKKDIKITSAVRLSASFGFVSPAANMSDGKNSPESSHFVDGGYNENYGVSSLLDWLDEALCTSPKEETPPKILIVQIVADNVFDEDTCATKQINCDIGNSWFAQTLAPASTLWNIRSSVQLARNESEIKLFLRYWRKKGFIIEKTVFQYLPKKENELAPLSWHLTPEQKQNINTIWETACKPNLPDEVKEESQNREAFQAFRDFITPGIAPLEKCRE